jgi:arylsulfatase A-like enzyme
MRIIYIDVDCLRPDHLSAYGYPRKISPNVQSIAERGIRFSNYHSSDTPCVPSRAAFTTQRFGISSGAFGHQGSDADVRLSESRSQNHDAPFFGYHLASVGGYHTVGMSCFAERHQAYYFHGNFMEFIRPSLSLGLDEDAKDVTDTAIDWLERRGKGDHWFLALGYWETHTEYMVEKKWADKAAASGPAPAWPDAATIERHQEVYGAHSAHDLHGAYGAPSPVPDTMPDAIKDRTDFEKLINGYDGTIAYFDHHLGRLFDKLKELGLYDNTAIVLTADHGEAFGENGIYAEHAMAHPATSRVPLIVFWPGVTENLKPEQREHDGLFYHLDFGPTLCEMLGIPVPKGWHGKSFAKAVRGETMDGRTYLVLSQGVHSFQRAVRMRDGARELFYMLTLHPGTYKVNPEELYDLTADPHMTHDLMPTQPELADPLKVILADWIKEYAGFPGAPPDPMQAALQRGPVLYSDPELYIARLEATGRKDQADDYKRRLGAFLKDRNILPDHEKPKNTKFFRF